MPFGADRQLSAAAWVAGVGPGPGDPSWWPGWHLPRHRQGEPGRISRNGSTCTTPATQRNTTLDAPNLVRDLGGNEPQFRSRWGIIEATGPASIEAGQACEKPAFFYCFEAVQRPLQPSDRTNEPEPLRPEKRPVLFQLTPWTDPPVLVEPFGLTDPELNSPEILPPEMTNLSVARPQGVPTETATHEPSKLPPLPPPPPPLLRDARRGASASGLARRAGFEGSTVRGAWREPDSDFSSLPMLPPALPDCATPRLIWRLRSAASRGQF